MVIELPAETPAKRTLPTRHVYLIGAVCLVCGLAAGYTVHGSRIPAPARPAASAPFHHPTVGQRPSLAQFQQMAAKQAAPLIEKLKTDPSNVDLLLQVGALYHATQQYPQAITYYSRAVAAEPKNVANRIKLASSLYRGGDPDAAIVQLNAALAVNPSDANSLFNLGLVKWEGKQDGSGALAAWKLLLKSNPQLAPERKATVQKLMNQVQTSRRPTPAN
ncbi:MAG TPA: tetratricopeptide repeat protein [Terracidiphilus sp.]|jgi:cytochrome c-type biogenesis protein CcmH/NrfG